MEIKLITDDEAGAIIASGIDSTIGNEYKPWGLFYYITKDRDNNTLFVGLDNSDGHCWVEEFYSIGACMAWLRGESDDD